MLVFGLPLGLIYLLVTLSVVGLCGVARLLNQDATDVFTAGAVILFLSCVTAVARGMIGHPWSLAVHPVQDVALFALFLGAYQDTRAKWAAALATLFAVDLFIHAGFWVAAWAAGEISDTALRAYVTKMNGMFWLILLTLTVAGGGYVVRYCRDLRDLPRLGRLAWLPRVHR